MSNLIALAVLASMYGQTAEVLAEAHAAAMLAAESDDTARIVPITARLSLPTGTYAKAGGTAVMHVTTDGTVYVDRRGDARPLTAVQTERQWCKLAFRIRDGHTLPLIRQTRVGQTEATRATPLSEEKLAELRALVGHEG